MEREYSRRGRSTSRASSTSSSLEVRCACQYYKSDSLLPERSALVAVRPAPRHTALRMVQTPPAGRKQPVRCGDHDYEPIGTPALRMAISQQSVSSRLAAPVVKITDTDMVPVGDSDDSIEDRYRFKEHAQILEGDVVLPLDGCIEDHEMQSRNLGDETIDASIDELDGSQHQQNKLNDASNNKLCLANELKPNFEIKNNEAELSKVESGRGFQEKFKNQAGKIRSRLRSIQKPNFSIPRTRSKLTEKTVTMTTTKTPSSPRSNQKASRMERFRMALPERPRFSLPDKSKFHLPDKSKFHLPDKSKFHLPDKSKFHLPERPKFNFPDKSKFHIKKPNIQLPKSLNRPRRTASERISQKSQNEIQTPKADSNTTSRRNIFDFSTYPRPKLFDRKSKTKEDYVTSSPKESRSQATESSTFPRSKKSSLSLTQRWAQRFGDTSQTFHDSSSINDENIIDRSKPWTHPSFEKPRLSLKPQTSKDDGDDEEEEEGDEEEIEVDELEEEEEDKLPWENTKRLTYNEEDEATMNDDERSLSYVDKIDNKVEDLGFGKNPTKDPKIYDEELMKYIGKEELKKKVRLVEENNEVTTDPDVIHDQTYRSQELLDGGFPPVDPRVFDQNQVNCEVSDDEEDSSIRSDRENQQSSGSSCERRRQGVIEEIDSDEFFLRRKGISEENMRFHLNSEIRDALRPRNALAHEIPPQRPKRTRSLRKRKDKSIDSLEETPPPERPKRDRGLLRRNQEFFGDQPSLERIDSLSRHRIVYQTDTPPEENEPISEPLDDIVVLKPERRKSKNSLRTRSQILLPTKEHSPVIISMIEKKPPPVPCRRKRLRRDQSSSLSLRTVDGALCNGYGNMNPFDQSQERIPPTPPSTPPPEFEEDSECHDIHSNLTPVPPKRTRSISRNASLPLEDDRTSHGAESLPNDFGYIDDELPTILRDSSSREPSLPGYPGYAIIEKKEKPPRPPPPRRKRQQKFATAPRPSKIIPTRPQRAYSTLRLAKFDSTRKSSESMPFIDHEYSLENDDDFHKGLLSGEVVVKMQGRPLPAPPRPPRHRRRICKYPVREITPDFSETVASTQTDPLPDDLIIEEEITSAKLIVTPVESGLSKVFISTERLPSPIDKSYSSTRSATPLTPQIPPSPDTVQQQNFNESHPVSEAGSDKKIPASGEFKRLDPSQLDILRSALFSTSEPLRIPSLEVSDLRVDRLTVSQMEAYKIAASEIDAIVVSATEMSSKNRIDSGISPSLIQELIVIKNQLDAVTGCQSHSSPHSVTENTCTATSNERVDFAASEVGKERERRLSFTKESSPLLVVQPSSNEQEATAEMGRTVFPLSSSSTDLTLMDTSTETATTILLTETAEESMSAIVEVTGECLATASDKQTPVTAAAKPPAHDAPTRARSRSPSPSRNHPGIVRQTASPVKSLPPVISVTPDNIITPETPDNNSMPLKHTTFTGDQPQRAVISYSSLNEETPSSPLPHHRSHEIFQAPSSLPKESSRTQSSPRAKESFHSSPAPNDSFQSSEAHNKFIAFQTSQIPPEFFRLVNPSLLSSTMTTAPQPNCVVEVEPGITEMIGQLFRALRLAGTRSLRHFVDSVVSRFENQSQEVGGEEKVRRIELTICALLIFIAVLIIVCICTPRSVTHHHHWDYFNPPQ